MGVAERVVDLARSETWVGPLNGLDRVTGMDSEIDEVHRDAGADNNGVAATDRRIFVHVEVFRLNWLRHDLAFRLWPWANPISTASGGQANRAPVLIPLSAQSGLEDAQLQFTIMASNLDASLAGRTTIPYQGGVGHDTIFGDTQDIQSE